MNILYSAITVGATIGLLALGISLLPDANGLPTGVQDSIYSIVAYMKAYSFLLDFNTLFTVVGIVLLTEITILGFKVLMWVFRLLTRTGSN